VLGADVTIDGNISAGVDLHLDGRVNGDVSCASLVQGAGSVIRGAVRADTARLAGTVEGSIDAKDLVIQASARITGDVSYDKLTIEPGGQVDGRFSPRAAAAPKVELVASN
jgi:cytoskeletal protein CcmA (bactofilin family)